MTAGLIAGSLAAMVAVLASLPLRSPSDTLFNSASVALAGLLAGAIAGGVWLAVRNSPAPPGRFLVFWSAICLPVAAAVIIYGRSQLDHFTGFVLPLALLIYGVTGILTVAIPRWLPNLKWWTAGIAVAAALLLGFGLVNQTDQESGELKLPPPGSRAVPAEAPALGGKLTSHVLDTGEWPVNNASTIGTQEHRGL